jgi:hypothetical protein
MQRIEIDVAVAVEQRVGDVGRQVGQVVEGGRVVGGRAAECRRDGGDVVVELEKRAQRGSEAAPQDSAQRRPGEIDVPLDLGRQIVADQQWQNGDGDICAGGR